MKYKLEPMLKHVSGLSEEDVRGVAYIPKSPTLLVLTDTPAKLYSYNHLTDVVTETSLSLLGQPYDISVSEDGSCLYVLICKNRRYYIAYASMKQQPLSFSYVYLYPILTSLTSLLNIPSGNAEWEYSNNPKDIHDVVPEPPFLAKGNIGQGEFGPTYIPADNYPQTMIVYRDKIILSLNMLDAFRWGVNNHYRTTKESEWKIIDALLEKFPSKFQSSVQIEYVEEDETIPIEEWEIFAKSYNMPTYHWHPFVSNYICILDLGSLDRIKEIQVGGTEIGYQLDSHSFDSYYVSHMYNEEDLLVLNWKKTQNFIPSDFLTWMLTRPELSKPTTDNAFIEYIRWWMYKYVPYKDDWDIWDAILSPDQSSKVSCESIVLFNDLYDYGDSMKSIDKNDTGFIEKNKENPRVAVSPEYRRLSYIHDNRIVQYPLSTLMFVSEIDESLLTDIIAPENIKIGETVTFSRQIVNADSLQRTAKDIRVSVVPSMDFLDYSDTQLSTDGSTWRSSVHFSELAYDESTTIYVKLTGLIEREGVRRVHVDIDCTLAW